MNDKTIIKDSNFAGFYHWQPIWIGADLKDIERKYSRDPNYEIYSTSMSCGIKVRVSIKGVFIFDFNEWNLGVVSSIGDWEGPVRARIQFMNLLLAFFYNSAHKIQRQTLEKMFIDYETYAFSQEFSLAPRGFGSDSRQASIIKENEKFHEGFMNAIPVVLPSVLSETIQLTDKSLTSNNRDSSMLGELLLKAFRLHDSGQYEASHISAWTIIERCLNIVWNRYLENAEEKYSGHISPPEKKFINNERRTKLTGRDFSMSIVSEILSLNGLIPFSQYELSCKVRQDRNNWLHKLSPIDRPASVDSINLARFLLNYSKVLDVDVPFHVISGIPLACSPDE